MIEEKNLTAVGKFQKTHALKGELNALLDIDPEFFEEGNAMVVDVDGIFVPFFTTGIRPKGATSYLVKLEGIDSEEEARRFVNKLILAEKAELAPFLDMEEDEIRGEDEFCGYRITDAETGNMLGVVERVDSSTSNLLFIVKTPEGDEIFIPIAEEFIDSIDDENREIHMQLPQGLIDLNVKKKE